MLQDSGYRTALFGKAYRHDLLDRDGKPVYETSDARGVELVKHADLTHPIADGPLDHGFDEFFGTVCCPTTDWLYAYIDGDRIPVLPTILRDRSKPPDHPYSKDCREGLLAPDFDLEEVDLVFLEKSQAFLRDHVANNPDQPSSFFTPPRPFTFLFPGDAFKGKPTPAPMVISSLVDYIVGDENAQGSRHR